MPELPTTFGKYFLTEKLATGGMAEIYLAKIVGPGGFEKQLVIKQIHPNLSGQRHFVDLFVAEAKTLVTLAHGNIVPVYELGVVDETYFIAMEYIDGPTLYRLTEALARRDAVMEPAVAAWIAARILEGLDYAHRKGEGVIHRDLSPRNVMLSRDGEVKLVDFGIAVALGTGEDETAKSAPTGSFPYMSPEQVRKEALTGQTDLFSVGVLLWEMLVGQRLFARNDPDATLAAVVDFTIQRPSALRPEVPPKLDEVVMRALERDRTSRWSSAGDMLAALQRYLYVLDATPGPRDVAALVARFCPPETRRVPTHAEELVDEPAADGTPPPPAPPHAGPATAVIPRDGSQPRGRQRQARQKSFATHVELKDMLERATPMFGTPAMSEADLVTEASAPEPAVPPPAEPAKPRAASVGREAPVDSPATTMRLPGRTAPSGALLVLAGIGASVLAVAAVVVFMRGRQAILAPDAAPKRDAPFYMLPDAAVATTKDAFVEPPAFDAAVDAAVDAAAPPARDAGPRLHADASVTMVIDAKPALTGTATLRIGADPWADFVIDGSKRGRTPSDVTVSAGHHTIELIYGGEDPPRKKTILVDVVDGETKPVYEAFTKPQ
jgi:serine/threonine-protein kinase